MIIYTKTNERFPNRKEAKKKMGHANFNRALENGEITFITYGETDIII